MKRILPLFLLLLSAPLAHAAPTAQIVVDEPSWFDNTSINQCDAETGSCYYPNLGLNQTRGYAPFGVLFQGGASTPKDAIVKWSWDFGAGTENDPHGRTFVGMNAVHIFETPGTYTVTLTVMDNQGTVSTATRSVTIMAPNGTTYYVDSQIGNDACNGTSQTVVSSSVCPWKTATKAFSQMVRTNAWDPLSLWHYKPGDRILFKRGQTFTTTSITIPHGKGTQGYGFGAYGDSAAAKPIIQFAGATTDSVISVGYGTGYISFTDLQINLLGPQAQSDSFFMTFPSTNNMLFLRDDFFEPGNGAVGVSDEGTTDNMTANIFLVDDTFQQPTTNTSAITLIYGFGIYNYALLGNTFDHSGNHISYNSDLHNVVIANNVFNRPAFGRTAIRITDGNSIYIADNSFLGWIDPVLTVGGAHNGDASRYNFSLIELSPNGGTKNYNLTNVIFERNTITNFETGLKIVNSGDVTVRNNIFVSPSPRAGTGFIQLSEPNGVDLTRPLTNIKVIGNTFVSNGLRGAGDSFINLFSWTKGSTAWGSNHQNINVSNNIFYAISGSQIRALNISGLDNNVLSTLTSNTNVLSIPSAPTNQPYSIGTQGYTLAQWQALSSNDSATVSSDPHFFGTISNTLYQPNQPSAATNIATAESYKNALRLTAASPANSGTVFPTDSYFDFANVARYLNDAFVDIGAFEYNVSAASNPTPQPLTGDLNSDHIVNALDWSLMNAKWFTNDTTADLNRDGVVNAIDFSLLNANWFKTW